MADKQIQGLNANPSPALTDKVAVDNAAGVTYYETVAQIAALAGGDGWVAGADTWSYSSADDPTFVISVNADVTALIGVGDRIKLTQTTTKYFIVTAVGAYGGGATLVTVYGGTDYDLANAAITSPYYSHMKSPFGFPLNPAKWTVLVTTTSDYSKLTGVTANTWYNVFTPTITVPIGAWMLEYGVHAHFGQTGGTYINAKITLSKANNTQDDVSFSCFKGGLLGGFVDTNSLLVRSNHVLLAAKTVYYLNANIVQQDGTSGLIYHTSSYDNSFIRAICAYL